MFNKEKTTLQVFGRNRVEDALASLFAALSDGLLFFLVIPLQYAFGLFFYGLFEQGGFQTLSMVFECKLLFYSCYIHRRACTHARSLLATLNYLCSL